jgi:hypothetical protein
MFVSIPFAFGYAIHAAFHARDRWAAFVALALTLVEAVALAWLLVPLVLGAVGVSF